jgi:hypothetical protein
MAGISICVERIRPVAGVCSINSRRRQQFQILSVVGSQPRWRRDGKESFYISADANLMAVELKINNAFQADPDLAHPRSHQDQRLWLPKNAVLQQSYASIAEQKARASRSSLRSGGLLSTRSTWGGMSPSATKRRPQPVSRITGVEGESAFTALATRRPST